MRAMLRPHPDFPSPVIEIVADAERSGARLSLTYRLTGDVDSVRLPASAAPARTDELWRHTCFEAFVAPASGEAYCELNFAPSGQWASYRFDGYRAGMRRADATPMVELLLPDGGLQLSASVDFASLPELATAPWRLALTAVIEAADGSLSYWSLAHPPGRPDFHHADCFALELPAPDGP